MATEGEDDGELVGWVTHWPTVPLLGWRTSRFLVLEHGTIVLYMSEEAWQQHHTPVLVLNLTFDSTVARGRRFGEPCIHVTTPEGSLVFSPEAEEGEEHAAAELWFMYLEQWLSLLTHERQNPNAEPPEAAEAELDQQLHRAAGPLAFGAGAHDGLSAALPAVAVAAEEETKDGVPAAAAAIDERDLGVKITDDEEAGNTEDASPAAPGGRARFNWGGGKRPRPKPHAGGGAGIMGWFGLGATPAAESGSSPAPPDGSGSGGVLDRTLMLLRNKKPSCRECKCIWCREENGRSNNGLNGGVHSSSHRHRHGFLSHMRRKHSHAFGSSLSQAAGGGLSSSSDASQQDGSSSARDMPAYGDREARRGAMQLRKRRRAAPKSRRLSGTDLGEEDDEYAQHVTRMWELVVARFVGLQAARSGDVAWVRQILEKCPDIPDKTNMFRAAVRFKHYDLVDYFLDVQKMDINLSNGAGMTLAWFAIMHFSKNDGGVMLRYMQSRGADISRPNKWGQSVCHFVATSEAKVAVPILKYLSEEHGLELHHKDMFGSLPLHWAALFGHLETVKWLSDVTCYVMARANWAWMFKEMQGIRIIRPEHLGAVRQWRARGLDKFASSVTPLGVAVLHNHEDIAKWLMGHSTDSKKEEPRHLQAKRRALFADKCRDLMLVSRTWPELLPDVLDGFCTSVHSGGAAAAAAAAAADNRRGGWHEKRYDIRLLFGKPEAKPQDTPLGILLETKYPPLFQLRIIQLVVALKWQIFGRTYYLYELSRYLLLCTVFVVGFIALPHTQNTAGATCRVLCWLLTLYNLIVEEGREMWAATSFREYLWSGWNVQSLCAYLLLLAMLPLYLAQWGEAYGLGEVDVGSYSTIDDARRLIVAPAALALFLRFMEHLAVWRTTSVLIAVVRMMFLETAKWSVLFTLFQGAFDIAFFGLLRGEDGYTSLGQTIITVFAMSMGQIDTTFSPNNALNVMATIMVIAFTLLVSVLYINLLVAMMTTSYEQVLGAASAQALMNRVETLLKWEGIMNKKQRNQAYSRIAPGKGRRAHLTLKSTLEGEKTSTEVFIYEDDVTVVEPAASFREDKLTKLWERLDAMSAQITALGEAIRRNTLSSGGSSSNGSGVAAGRAFARRVGLAGFGGSSGAIGSSSGSVGGGGGNVAAARAFRDAARRVVAARASAEEVEVWRRRAEDIALKNRSRKAIIKAQAVVRGHLERKKLRAIYENPPPEEEQDRGARDIGDGRAAAAEGSRWRPRWR